MVKDDPYRKWCGTGSKVCEIKVTKDVLPVRMLREQNRTGLEVLVNPHTQEVMVLPHICQFSFLLQLPLPMVCFFLAQ